MKRINYFKDDLAWSDAASDAPFWAEVYQRMFPGSRVLRNEANNPAQRFGIDTVVMLPAGRSINVQEKNRRKDYPDILIEFEHVGHKGNRWPGWIDDERNQADWLAYAFIPSRRCYFFPFPSLQSAWRELRKTWFTKARLREDGFALPPPAGNDTSRDSRHARAPAEGRYPAS
jgi:hypothetical protein